MYARFCDEENIYNAYLKARNGRRYKDEILRFSYNIEKNLQNIVYELKNKNYKHGLYYEFVVNDSKKRVIRAAPFKDRIMHHALCNIIEPEFEKTFIYDSYACRLGKGLHKAIKRFKQFLRIIKLKNNLKDYNNIYVLKCDIVQYFNSVNKNILFELIKRKIKDENILAIILIILNSYEKGLPIGNLTSQLFANIYLHELDFYIKNELKCKYYIRYMDDFIIFDLDKKKLWEKYGLIKNFVFDKLNLKIDDNKTKLIPIKRGISFLGFIVFGDEIRLRQSTIKRFKKKIHKKWVLANDDEKLAILAIKFCNWKSYYKHGDAYIFSKRLFCKIGEKYDKDIWEFANRR